MADMQLTTPEREFVARFDHEAYSGRPGPAHAWLAGNETPPDLMVAFQWAAEPRPSIEAPRGVEVQTGELVLPWPSREAFLARLDAIVAAHTWLEPYCDRSGTTIPGDPPDDAPGAKIPMYRLRRGRHYVGRGRNGNVGLWNGLDFLVVAEKIGRWVVKEEPYYAETTGCFQPFKLVDEGRMAVAYGGVGWDAHYGRRMEFGPDE